MKVLIIDDDLSLCHKMKKFILTCGNYDVHYTNSGKKSLNLIKSNNYNTIFLDLFIEDMNGLKLLKTIKNNCDTKVIIITVFPTVKTAVNCMKIGAADYWSKPFNMDRIKGEI